MMQPPQVDETIRNYEGNLVRYRHISLEIARLTKQLDEIEKEIAYPSAMRLSGMPSSHIISDETAQKAALLADGDLDETKATRAMLARLKKERERIKRETQYVNNWLKALNERQEYVVRQKLIQMRTWQFILTSFENQFGYIVSMTTLRRLKAEALKKIYEVAN